MVRKLGLVALVAMLEVRAPTKTIDLTSTPTGAAITLDGAALGTTPLKKELTFKDENDALILGAKLAGYDDSTLRVTYTPPDLTKYNVILLKSEGK